MSRYLANDINDIRIIPMQAGSETIEQHQEEYFEDRLPNQEKGWYNYYQSGLLSKEDDLLLFQYDNHIIASGVLDSLAPNKSKNAIQNFGYKGSFILKKGTIKTFEPITTDELQQLIADIKLTQAKHHIKKADIIDLEGLLNRLEIPR